ncbi:5-oxoprolinase subunit C family protein [Marinicrinis sediminis]|uniref:Biotin-dependent carboxyltransferase family protein n=1 Tax=Marinicrinis sediminis TaxID=1652465 RepID=A0ABW5R8C7_9BACL
MEQQGGREPVEPVRQNGTDREEEVSQRIGMKVKKPGVYTTLQDQGRIGHRHLGVPVSGVMDRWSSRVANRLLGNEDEAAVLEMTWVGPTLDIQQGMWISICGGACSVQANQQEIPMWRPVYLPAGTVLSIGSFRKGCRAYLAVQGGFEAEIVLGSRSTYVRGGFGGIGGRTLRAGDELVIRPSAALNAEQPQNPPCIGRRAIRTDRLYRPSWRVPILDWKEPEPVIRVMEGREIDSFPKRSREKLKSTDFRILPQSDRMGYRLEGSPLHPLASFQMKTEPVTVGTVQVPPNGQPVILMADGQATGGYPRIAQVASVDVPVLAQLPPGTSIRFAWVSVTEAEQLWLQREAELEALTRALALKGRLGDKDCSRLF